MMSIMDLSKNNTPRLGEEFTAVGIADLSKLDEASVASMDRRTLEKLLLETLKEKQILEEKLMESEIMSSIDALSGLHNKSYFDEMGSKIFHDVSKASTGSFTVIMIDINGLKKINDTEQDHYAGDALIAATAARISNMFRHSDILCRTGGDEFGIIVPNGNVRDIEMRLDALQNRINVALPDKRQMNAAFSYGASVYEGQSSFKDMVREADKAMYDQKQDRKAQGLTTVIHSADRKISDYASDYIPALG